jgi:hypothetical protein
MDNLKPFRTLHAGVVWMAFFDQPAVGLLDAL